MNAQHLRVAFFPGCLLRGGRSRQYQPTVHRICAAAGLSMLAVHASEQNRDFRDGSVIHIERKRKWPSFYLDTKSRLRSLLLALLRRSKSNCARVSARRGAYYRAQRFGIMGAVVAYQLGVPIAASWHTNVHEYAQLRAAKLLRGLPESWRTKLGQWIRRGSFAATARFYQTARILLLQTRNWWLCWKSPQARGCSPMGRGVDTTLFHPCKRDRVDSDPFTIGFVGHITVEKNVRLLVELEKALLAAGIQNFRFLIVGQGVLEPWLRQNLCRRTLPAFSKEMHWPCLCQYGRVRLPLAHGYLRQCRLESPVLRRTAVVTNEGGPKFLIKEGETGFISADTESFARAVRQLAAQPQLLEKMRRAARESALSVSWDAVFQMSTRPTRPHFTRPGGPCDPVSPALQFLQHLWFIRVCFFVHLIWDET